LTRGKQCFILRVMEKQRDPVLDKAIEEAGGPAELARFITEHYSQITPQAICDWKKCPWRRAAQVEAAVKAKGGTTTAQELCPEVFKVAEASEARVA
jgi:hypothetical protein